MADISPVLASFLAGQGNQADLIKMTQNIIAQKQEAAQRQQQLDDVMRRFQVESKQAGDKLDLEHQIFQLNHKKAMSEEGDRILEQFRTGQRPAPQVAVGGDNVKLPPVIPGMPNIVQGPTMQQRAPIGTPVTVDSPYGKITVPLPEDAGEAKIKDALAQQKALAPGIMDLFTQQHNIMDKAKSEQLQAKLDSQEGMFADKLDMQKTLADLRVASAEQIASMRQQYAGQEQLFRMGFGSPADFKTQVLDLARGKANGTVDPASLAGSPLKNQVERAQRELGLHDLPGGAKTRRDILSLGQEGAMLINKYDDINTLLPASSRATGKAVQTIMKMVPGTSEHNKYNEFESNLMNYAKTSSGITSSRLLDSNKEQSRFMGSLPKPTDNPVNRVEKRLNLIDNVFTHIQDSISGLSNEQKKDFWIEILKDPKYIELGQDSNLRENLIKPLIQTGQYSSTFLNSMKRSGKK